MSYSVALYFNSINRISLDHRLVLLFAQVKIVAVFLEAANDVNAGRVSHIQPFCGFDDGKTLSDDHLDYSPLNQV